MPESVKRRSSSGPTIGATVRRSGVVAMPVSVRPIKPGRRRANRTFSALGADFALLAPVSAALGAHAPSLTRWVRRAASRVSAGHATTDAAPHRRARGHGARRDRPQGQAPRARPRQERPGHDRLAGRLAAGGHRRGARQARLRRLDPDGRRLRGEHEDRRRRRARPRPRGPRRDRPEVRPPHEAPLRRRRADRLALRLRRAQRRGRRAARGWRDVRQRRRPRPGHRLLHRLAQARHLQAADRRRRARDRAR